MNELEKAKEEIWNKIRDTVPFCLQDSFNLGFDAGVKAERERILKVLSEGLKYRDRCYTGDVFELIKETK